MDIIIAIIKSIANKLISFKKIFQSLSLFSDTFSLSLETTSISVKPWLKSVFNNYSKVSIGQKYSCISAKLSIEGILGLRLTIPASMKFTDICNLVWVSGPYSKNLGLVKR